MRWSDRVPRSTRWGTPGRVHVTLNSPTCARAGSTCRAWHAPAHDRSAPVTPVQILYPVKTPVIEWPYIGAGMALHDACSVSSGGCRTMPLRRHLSRREGFDNCSRSVINGTSVWTDEAQRHPEGAPRLRVRMSKCAHIFVEWSKIPSDLALSRRTAKSVFQAVPRGRHWLVGTTDTPWGGARAEAAATSTDIRHLLDRLNFVVASQSN